jgi:hypothetical protein
MPSLRRFSSLLLLLSGMALLTAGCERPPLQTDIVLPEVVIVAVDYDPSTQKATVMPKEIRLKEQKQYVRWMSCDGEVEVEFDATDTPFDTPPGLMKKASGPSRAARISEVAGTTSTLKHHVDSKTPKKGSARLKPYEYKVFLVLPGGTRIPADPRVIVDP